MGGCDQLELEHSCNGADGPGGLGSIGREKGKEKSKEWEKCEQRSGGKNQGVPIKVASLLAQRVKDLPAMRETRIRSLGREDTLEEEMSTHSSILAWRIPWMEKRGAGYSLWGHKELDTTE